MKSISRVRLLATPWTAAYQGPPPMGFSRQEYWSGVPLPSLSLSIYICMYVYIYKTTSFSPYFHCMKGSCLHLNRVEQWAPMKQAEGHINYSPDIWDNKGGHLFVPLHFPYFQLLSEMTANLSAEASSVPFLFFSKCFSSL